MGYDIYFIFYFCRVFLLILPLSCATTERWWFGRQRNRGKKFQCDPFGLNFALCLNFSAEVRERENTFWISGVSASTQ
jgi:hypothetical protein